MPTRIEHSFTTAFSPKRCWEIYISPRHDWDKLLGDTRWLSGEPFQVGSIAESDVTGFGATYQRRVIGVTPGREIGWINHGIAMTGEQWITFTPLADGGTRVETWNDVYGKLETFDGLPAMVGLKKLYLAWLAQFQAECDRHASK